MDNNPSFIKQYVDFVRSADILKTRPSRIKDDTQVAIEDIGVFSNSLVAALDRLYDYPPLAESLYAKLESNAITGHLGEFLIQDAIAQCDQFVEIEQTVLAELETIGNAALNFDKNLLIDFEKKVKSWRHLVNIDNIIHIRRFLESLQQQVHEQFDALSEKEKLGIALARSEQERKRLIEEEETRRRGISERELDKEEKRRRAREEFMKNTKIRKKK